MLRSMFRLIVALVPLAAAAQDVAPMQSAACQQALLAVQAQETQTAAAQQTDPQAGLPANRAALAHLGALRQRAAQVCLGNRVDRPSSRPGQQDRPPSRPGQQDLPSSRPGR
jgi:hypothetical protein